MARRPTAEGQRERADSSAYLRSKTPIRVRRDFRDWKRLPFRWIAIAGGLLGVGLSTAYSVDGYLRSGERFRFPSDGSGLRITELRFLAPAGVKKVFRPDLGASVYEIPLEERRNQMLKIPWVKQATVLRVWPNQLRVKLEERRPVAFVRLPPGKQRGRSPKLIDSVGVFLEPPGGVKLVLPVVTGIRQAMPLPERRKRTELLAALIEDLDSAEPRYSEMISEVDLADAQSAEITTVHDGEVVNLKMGDEHFRHRYEVFLKYINSWRNEFGKVRSVDLRFKGHVAIQ